jgi:chromosome condensin MukBEF ATPase and DNA-binding subunit MukB
MERVSLAKTLLLLEAIKLSPSTAKHLISEFQEYIWGDRVRVDQNESLEILRDLAHVLDYFEAEPSLRAEDNAFFDEEKLKAEIESALNNMKSLAAYRIEVKG